VVSRALIFGVVLAVTQPAIAQQTGPETDPVIKDNVTQFEQFLKMAIKEAGQLLVRQVDAMQPSTQLKVPMAFDAAPIASGVVIPSVGPVFTVLIPGILPSNLSLWELVQQDAFRKVDPRQASQGRPVQTGTDKLTANNLPSSDPMTASPALDFDPTRAYTSHAREKLIDALLDFSRRLPLKPGEYVTIVAKDMLDVQPTQPTQLSGRIARQLILSIKSEDLMALHEGKITRDEAKQRIVDTRF
jgi:hypothetical protein